MLGAQVERTMRACGIGVGVGKAIACDHDEIIRSCIDICNNVQLKQVLSIM